jgi:DNA-binding transcriptional LysR family regulator
MQLRDLDLNLLVIFHQLLLDRSVSVAAQNLEITQPAMSNALKRLRTALNDDLFVRTNQGMQPTPYAMQLAEPVANAIGTLHGALNRLDDFDPATTQKCFVIAMTDIGEIYFMPKLIQTLLTLAPGVSVTTLRSHAGLSEATAFSPSLRRFVQKGASHHRAAHDPGTLL